MSPARPNQINRTHSTPVRAGLGVFADCASARHAESDCYMVLHPSSGFSFFPCFYKGKRTPSLAQSWRPGPIVETYCGDGGIFVEKGCLLQIFSINCHQNIGTTSRDSEMGPIAILMMTTITTQREDIIDFYWIKTR